MQNLEGLRKEFPSYLWNNFWEGKDPVFKEVLKQSYLGSLSIGQAKGCIEIEVDFCSGAYWVVWVTCYDLGEGIDEVGQLGPDLYFVIRLGVIDFVRKATDLPLEHKRCILKSLMR